MGLPDCLKQREFRSPSHGDEAIDRRYLTKGMYQVLSDVKVTVPVEMKLVYYLSLTLLLLVTLTSPTLLASVPVSIDTDGDGVEDSQDADDDGDNPEFASVDEAPVNLGESLEADAVLDDFSQSEEVQNIAPICMLIMPITMRPANRRPRSILDRT